MACCGGERRRTGKEEGSCCDCTYYLARREILVGGHVLIVLKEVMDCQWLFNVVATCVCFAENEDEKRCRCRSNFSFVCVVRLLAGGVMMLEGRCGTVVCAIHHSSINK